MEEGIEGVWSYRGMAVGGRIISGLMVDLMIMVC